MEVSREGLTIDSDQESSPQIGHPSRSRDIRTATLELGGGLVGGLGVDWGLVGRNDKKWQRFASYALIGLFARVITTGTVYKIGVELLSC